jgi:hypothetical protein
MFEVVGECSNSSCKFIHRKDEDEWDMAPVLDKRTARLLIQKATATRGLRSLSTERKAARESVEEKKEANTSSSSSERKVVSQTTAIRSCRLSFLEGTWHDPVCVVPLICPADLFFCCSFFE